MNFGNFQEALRGKLTPIALKLEGQKHLQAIKSGMVGSLPILIIEYHYKKICYGLCSGNPRNRIR